MVCYDVQVEPALQPITGEELARGTNQAPDARLDVHCRGFWKWQRAAFFDIRVCHPNVDSYRDLSPKQIYRIHEKEKKRKYNSRVTETEQDTFTPLVFTTTGDIADACLRYHSRLAELLSAKKQLIIWILCTVLFNPVFNNDPQWKTFTYIWKRFCTHFLAETKNWHFTAGKVLEAGVPEVSQRSAWWERERRHVGLNKLVLVNICCLVSDPTSYINLFISDFKVVFGS